MLTQYTVIFLISIFLSSCSFFGQDFLTPRSKRFSGERTPEATENDRADDLIKGNNKTGNPQNPEEDAFGEPKNGETFSGKKSIMWRRYRSIEANLSSALALAEDSLCKEIEKFSCVRQVHLTFLGGNDPYELAQYRPLSNPAILTSLSFERVVVSSCVKRLALDSEGNPLVFRGFPLDENIPQKEQVDFLTNTLYQRFHGRDAERNEIATAIEGVAGLTGADAAMTLCVAVGSHLEMIFN